MNQNYKKDPEYIQAVEKALDWVKRGMPEDEIKYSDDCPKLTEEQLREFEPASFKIGN